MSGQPLKPWIRFVVRLYPAAWRARYGDEYEALLEQMRPGWRDVCNVLRGALEMQATAWSFARTVVAAGLLGAIVAGVFALRMPGKYVSSGVLKIPGGAGRDAVAALLPEGLSRQFLHSLIARQGLYKRERRNEPMEYVVERMRHDISLSILEASRESAVQVRFSYPDAAVAQSTNRALMHRMQEMQAKLQGRAEIVDAASLPRDASGPNRAVVILYGLAAGLLAGAIGAIVRRRPGWSLRVTAMGLAAMVLGAAASFAIPNRYVSSTVIRLRPMEPPIGELARRPDFLARVVTRANLYESVRQRDSMEAALARIRRDLTLTKVSSAAGRDVVKIVFRYGDRHQAQKALREMISAVVMQYAEVPALGSPEYQREFLAWRAIAPDGFEVIDPPSLPEVPVAPNRLAIALGALAAGVAFGAYRWRRPPAAAPAPAY